MDTSRIQHLAGILTESKYSELVTEGQDPEYEQLLESIEELYEKWFGLVKDKPKDDLRTMKPDPANSNIDKSKDPTKQLSMSRVHTVMLSPSDKGMNLKGKVFGIRNEDPIVNFLLGILGVPMDGAPIQIRTGFMRYDNRSKMLFIAKFKSDLPGLKK